jgi:phospholipase A1
MTGSSIERRSAVPQGLRAATSSDWPAALVGVALGLGALAAAAQDPGCRGVADGAQRLACYDRAADAAAARAEPAAAAALSSTAAPAAPAAPAAAAAPAPPADQPGLRLAAAAPPRAGWPRATLTDRWELDPSTLHARFTPRPYNPVYLLPLVASSPVNRRPSSPSQALSSGERLPLQSAEMKFQLSLKTKLVEGLFDGQGNVWAAYTQSSRWQVYNGAQSRPFRETNYEPELMLVFGTDYNLLGARGKLLGLSLNHQSNGRASNLSRSWNRVIGMAGFEQGDWTLMLRPWWRIPEAQGSDDNADIADMLGRGDLVLSKLWGQHLVSLQLRHSLRKGSAAHGSAMLDWSFPLLGNLKGHLELFTGQGESLIDYNFRQTRVGLGLSLIEWR